jgi:prepilin-type N-terminal cleavage/methylation domain-containing protein
VSPGSRRPISASGPFRRRDATAATGFTLVEMLVVLVIAALISGVLLSAFERVLDIRVRLAAFLDGVDAPTLVADWFRASVGGLVPDAKTGRDRFAGTESSSTPGRGAAICAIRTAATAR